MYSIIHLPKWGHSFHLNPPIKTVHFFTQQRYEYCSAYPQHKKKRAQTEAWTQILHDARHGLQWPIRWHSKIPANSSTHYPTKSSQPSARQSSKPKPYLPASPKSTALGLSLSYDCVAWLLVTWSIHKIFRFTCFFSLRGSTACLGLSQLLRCSIFHTS